MFGKQIFAAAVLKALVNIYNSVIKSLRCFNREIKSEDFDRDNTITYQGVRVEMVRENGSSWMKFTGVDGKAAT